jgi:hypothetical protein
VLEVRRIIVPHGREADVQQSQATTDGTCDPNVECVRLTRQKLSELYLKLVALPPLRHESHGVSPHYGSRSIVAKWPDQSCSFVDDSTRPLVRADRDLLSELLDMIGDAIVAARSTSPHP